MPDTVYPRHPITRQKLLATPDEVAIIKAMVVEGASITAIASDLGINKQTARRWINAAGFPNYKRSYRHTPDGDTAMLREAREGRTATEIANELGIKPAVIQARLRFLARQGIIDPTGQSLADRRRRFAHSEATDEIIREGARRCTPVAALAKALGTTRGVVISRAHALMQSEADSIK